MWCVSISIKWSNCSSANYYIKSLHQIVGSFCAQSDDDDEARIRERNRINKCMREISKCLTVLLILVENILSATQIGYRHSALSSAYCCQNAAVAYGWHFYLEVPRMLHEGIAQWVQFTQAYFFLISLLSLMESWCRDVTTAMQSSVLINVLNSLRGITGFMIPATTCCVAGDLIFRCFT